MTAETGTSNGHGFTVEMPRTEAVKRIRQVSDSLGFGLIRQIDVHDQPAGGPAAGIGPYTILAIVCPLQPEGAEPAVPDPDLGLPCNVLVYQCGTAARISVQLPPAHHCDQAEALHDIDTALMQALTQALEAPGS